MPLGNPAGYLPQAPQAPKPAAPMSTARPQAPQATPPVAPNQGQPFQMNLQMLLQRMPWLAQMLPQLGQQGVAPQAFQAARSPIPTPANLFGF